MWAVFLAKISVMKDAFKEMYKLYSWWAATGICALCIILDVILFVPNLIYLLWSSWYIARNNKKYGEWA